MLVQAGKIIHLRHLGFSHFAGIDTTQATATRMHMEHDLRGLLHVHGKELLQHLDDEVHRGVVIVEQQHLPPGRRLQCRPRRRKLNAAVFVKFRNL